MPCVASAASGMDVAEMLSVQQNDAPVEPAEWLARRKSREPGQPTNVPDSGQIDRTTLKRLRNRVSASRCRIKKKVWVNELEANTCALEAENEALGVHMRHLEMAIARLRGVLEMPDDSGNACTGGQQQQQQMNIAQAGAAAALGPLGCFVAGSALQPGSLVVDPAAQMLLLGAGVGHEGPRAAAL